MDLYELLGRLDFLEGDIRRARAQGMATVRDFWERTESSHLLLELAGGLVEYGSLDIRTMVLCAVGAAEQTLAYVPWGVMAPRCAVRAAKCWALGEDTRWWKVTKALAAVSKSIPVQLSTAEGFATAAAAQCARSALFAANPEVPVAAVAEADLAVAYARTAIMTHLGRNEEFRNAIYSEQLRLANLDLVRAIRRTVSWNLIEPGVAAFEARLVRAG